MSEAARGQLERDIDRQQKEIQRFTQDAQEEVQQLQQDLQNGFQGRLLPVIQQVVAERGLQILFSQNDSGIVWADSALDITNDVIKRFDAAAPAATSTAPTTTPAAPPAGTTAAPAPAAKPPAGTAKPPARGLRSRRSGNGQSRRGAERTSSRVPSLRIARCQAPTARRPGSPGAALTARRTCDGSLCLSTSPCSSTGCRIATRPSWWTPSSSTSPGAAWSPPRTSPSRGILSGPLPGHPADARRADDGGAGPGRRAAAVRARQCRAERQAYLRGVDNAKFRRQVVPGDRLRLEVTLGRERPPLVRAHGTAYVAIRSSRKGTCCWC